MQAQESADAHEATTASSLYRLLADHPGVAFSSLYLVSSAIGMLDSWSYYRQFDINIFFYSDLADFLLASFRSPTVWLIVGWTALVTALEQLGGRRLSRRGSPPRRLRWLASRRYRRFSAAFGIALTIAFIVLRGEAGRLDHRGAHRKGSASVVREFHLDHEDSRSAWRHA
jgi:hypothetical protein